MATPPHPNRLLITGLLLGAALPAFASSSPAATLPQLAIHHNASIATTQWVMLGYLIGLASIVIVAGRLGDLHGDRRILTLGAAGFAISSAASAIAPDLATLTLSRIIQGACAATLIALTMSTASKHTPPHRLGTTMGAIATMSAIGTAAGPPLGGVLYRWGGQPAVFATPAALGAILAVTYLFTLKSTDQQGDRPTPTPIHKTSVVLLAGTLGCFALTITTNSGQFTTINAALGCATVVFGWLFHRTNRQATTPIIPTGLAASPRLATGMAQNILVVAIMMGSLIVGPFYLSAALGLPPQHVGATMAIGPIVAALTGIPAGRLVDTLGTRTVMLWGHTHLLIGCVTMALIRPATGIAGYGISLALITSGFALFQAANNTTVIQHHATTHRGVVSGLLNLSRNAGGITGAAAMGVIFTLGANTTDHTTLTPATATNGLHAAFWVATGSVLIALALALIPTTPQPATHHHA